MDKTSIKRLGVKTIARSVGLRLACLLIGLCGGCVARGNVDSGWFESLSDARFTAMTRILGTALGAGIVLLRVAPMRRGAYYADVLVLQR